MPKSKPIKLLISISSHIGRLNKRHSKLNGGCGQRMHARLQQIEMQLQAASSLRQFGHWAEVGLYTQ